MDGAALVGTRRPCVSRPQRLPRVDPEVTKALNIQQLEQNMLCSFLGLNSKIVSLTSCAEIGKAESGKLHAAFWNLLASQGRQHTERT